MSVRMRALIMAPACAFLLAVQGCGGGPVPDENDPWMVVNAYIEALNAEDRKAIEGLVDPAYDPAEEIDSRLRRLGGRNLFYETMQFHGTGMADITSVDLGLKAPANNTTYQDSLSLTRSDGRWRISLGKHR
ncbi:hypothetical protein [Actinoplanes sp. NPDC026670]|uniref:hypothetical protein n=1 Tax=Actinoplanes sp. NPDC026670 TaxID=3154700 RepID=UPI003405BD66